MFQFVSIPEGYDMIQSLLTWEQWLFMIIIPGLSIVTISSLIGMERQNIGKAAGISSHVLVGLSAMMISVMQRVLLFSQINNGVAVPEGQRIIAQVIAGIGFIGAGVIMKDSGNVIRGITTAATIWFCALLGIMFGTGMLYEGLAFGVFVVLFIMLRDFKRGFNPFKPSVPGHHEDMVDELHIQLKK